MLVDAVLWIVRRGLPQRHLPMASGDWKAPVVGLAAGARKAPRPETPLIANDVLGHWRPLCITQDRPILRAHLPPIRAALNYVSPDREILRVHRGGFNSTHR
jgi:hypothetical protein